MKRPELIVEDAVEMNPANVESPETFRVETRLSVPAERTPMFPFVLYRFVLDAVVEKRLVVVALPSVTVPAFRFVLKRLVEDAVVEKKPVVVAFVIVAFPVRTRVVPSKVRLALSVNVPAAARYGMRFCVSEETVRLVVEAVVK